MNPRTKVKPCIISQPINRYIFFNTFNTKPTLVTTEEWYDQNIDKHNIESIPVVVAAFKQFLNSSVALSTCNGITVNCTSRGSSQPGNRFAFLSYSVRFNRRSTLTSHQQTNKLFPQLGASPGVSSRSAQQE